MRPRPARASVGRPLGLLVVAVMMAALALVLAPAASAHDGLAGSDPADKAQLTTAPTEVTLSFDETPLTAGLAVVVTGADGTDVTAGKPTVSGTDVVTPLVPRLANGTYTVRWRVVATDGHPSTGTLTFTVTLETVTAAPEAAPSNSDLLSVAQSPGVDLTPWMVGGSLALLVVIVILGVLGVLARRRSS